jgi:hypothetical protein
LPRAPLLPSCMAEWMSEWVRHAGRQAGRQASKKCSTVSRKWLWILHKIRAQDLIPCARIPVAPERDPSNCPPKHKLHIKLRPNKKKLHNKLGTQKKKKTPHQTGPPKKKNSTSNCASIFF